MTDYKKVLGFDNWTRGAHHFERLVRPFKQTGLELSLLHLGSWGNDVGRPVTETAGTLEIRDISYYGDLSFPEILEREKPDAVLFMSTDTFAHRAFNRYCRSRGVPTVHVYHGLIRVQAIDQASQYRTHVLAQAKYAASKIPKALRYVWPTYARALWHTGAAPREWGRFGNDILAGAFGRYKGVSARDARTDKCCVYVEADVEHAVNKYGFAREDVFAVGNPDLIQFGLEPDLIGSHERNQDGEANVMYVDTGLVHTGWVFSSPSDFVEHVTTTRDKLDRQGKHLIFKPHPDHFRTEICSTLATKGIDICSRENFVPRLRKCCAAIVEPSSLAVLPALIGMPLFLAKYGKLSDQTYGEVLTSYPGARSLPDLDLFNSLLAEHQSGFDQTRTMQWIKHNSGPLPADEMPHRVAQITASAILGPSGQVACRR